jgi:hypothetical protein
MASRINEQLRIRKAFGDTRGNPVWSVTTAEDSQLNVFFD